jgi:CDGSH-type Zn-finger protein
MDERPTIECTPNGPDLVRRLDHLEGSQGQALADQPVMALCRCGGSANKPFCDGTHWNIGFKDEMR